MDGEKQFMKSCVWFKCRFLKGMSGFFSLLVVFLVLSLNLSATLYAQMPLLDIELKDATFESLISSIKKQCEVGFIYDYEEVKGIKGITISARNESLESILERALDNTGFSATIEKNTIILRKNIGEQNSKLLKPIKGKVSTRKNEVLPGVTVMIKGTTIGTVTNEKGEFQLTVPDPIGKVLSFSFIGMANLEVEIKNEETLNIIMEEVAAEIEEAVVTGIYSRKKESFTGSAQTYTNKELKMTGTMNVLQSLKTLDPSFVIVENDLYGSDPNRMPEININGQSSIKALHSEYDKDPNAPLFILDGFETTLETINDLSMDRVQSITLLKDAASTAIYGAKAANGVVVVETKAPVAGKLRVNYNGAFQIAWADLSDYNLMDAAEKLEFEKLSGYYGTYDKEGFFTDKMMEQKYYSRLSEVLKGVDTYWMSEPLRVAFTHGHTVFIEGGDNIFRYSLGLSYRNTAGVMKGSNRDALNGNIRMIYRYKNLSFTNLLNIDNGNAISENANFSDFSRANPYYRKVNEYGQVTKVLESFPTLGDEYEKVYNPLYDMQQNSLGRTKNYSFRNNFSIEWKFKSMFTLRGRFSVAKSVSKSLNFRSPNLTTFGENELTERGSYSESNSENLTYDGDATLNFGKVFAEKHLLNALLGMNVQSNSSNLSGYSVRGFLTDRFDNPAFSNGYTEGSKPSYSESEVRSASYYFNGGYVYDNRYLLDFNFRMDGTSVFGVNNLFTKTWAVGVAWNVHNEKFFRQSEMLTYLKLRFSIGNPGNQNMDAKMANNAYKYVTSYPNMFGLAAMVDTWGNKDLDWQKTMNTNYGVDMELFKRYLKVTLEYYQKKSDPQVVAIDLPPSTGSGAMPSNLGGLKSYGVTMNLNVFLMRKEDMRWSINANLRHAKSKYYNIGNALEKYSNSEGNVSNKLMRFYDGASTTDLYAIRSAGIDPATGREIFIKKDGTPTYIYDANEQVKVGNSTPTVEGIVGTAFYYKGLSCNINFRYRNGGQIFLQTLYEKVENIGEKDLRQNQDKRALYDRWKKPGDNAKFKAISLTEETPISSRFVADENTFSCESITVNYETQAKWLRYAGITSLTVSASTTDIFRISSVKNERGLNYPFQRSVNFSVGIRF